mgnify:CR=1 FL=1
MFLMKINDVVVHLEHGCNWMFPGCTKNPRSGNRRVKIISLYHDDRCAVISPVSGNGKEQEYVCNVSDLKCHEK